jgi:hypothetical protein
MSIDDKAGAVMKVIIAIVFLIAFLAFVLWRIFAGPASL